MPTQKITIRECDIHLVNLQTRMPFKYGIATMTRVPHAFVRLRADVDGKSSVGISADLLPPKWFTKDPDKPVLDEVLEMMRVVRHASTVSAGLTGESAFALWQQLYQVQGDWGRRENLPPLLTHFGTSLVERALIEATCRALSQPFAKAVFENQLGIRLGEIHPALRGASPRDLLAAKPLERIILRHTVGLLDPLLDEHIAPENRLQDGLPQSLAACARTYGLRHFKIKVTGHPDHDLDRLDQIARVLSQHATVDYRFTLDGNEQFKSLANFREYWETVESRASLREFLQHLLFVEQPLHRDVALQPDVGRLFADWPARAPIIIDESDASLDSVPAALSLGYAGTSHKNCKGIFKGLANRCLLLQQQKTNPTVTRVMSGEDLCTIGPISVLQDLAVMATLGIESVERNGHHYFPGLSMFSKEIQQQVLAAHPDLYQPSRFGWPKLGIQDGFVHVGTLNQQPFGVGFVLDVEKFTPFDGFQPA